MKKESVAQDVKAIANFAKALLPEAAPPGSVAHVFALPSKRCLWPANAAELAEAISHSDSEGDDVYIGVALRKVGLGKLTRGTAADCTHVLGVGLDVDVGTDGHGGGKKRFETIEKALAFINNAVELAPTAIINSGGGLHLWWLYHEPFDIYDLADRNLAANVAYEWHARVAEAAKVAGNYSIDSTFDIARILRFPGTRNRKLPLNPRSVELLELVNSRRYDPKDLADSLGADPKKLSKKSLEEVVMLGEKLTLNSAAKPDMDKLYALTTNDDWFARLMKRDASCARKLKDPSASGFDLAIANVLVRVGWSDQEIADLLIYNRRQHGNELKLREKYYAKTIAMARQGTDGTMRSAKENERQHEAEAADAIREVAMIDEPEERRMETIAMISKATGVGISRIVSNGRDPARYRIHLIDGTVLHVESTRELIRQDRWLCLAFEVNAKVPAEPLSQKNWRMLLTHMAQIAEFERDDDTLNDALAEYLEKAIDMTENAGENRAAALAARNPVVLDGGLPGICLSTFIRWLNDNGRKVDIPALKARLRAIGFAVRTLSFSLSGASSSRSYWVGPANWTESRVQTPDPLLLPDLPEGEGRGEPGLEN